MNCAFFRLTGIRYSYDLIAHIEQSSFLFRMSEDGMTDERFRFNLSKFSTARRKGSRKAGQQQWAQEKHARKDCQETEPSRRKLGASPFNGPCIYHSYTVLGSFFNFFDFVIFTSSLFMGQFCSFCLLSFIY